MPLLFNKNRLYSTGAKKLPVNLLLSRAEFYRRIDSVLSPEKRKDYATFAIRYRTLLMD